MLAFMRKYTPIESEFADSNEEAAYDVWFRAKVEKSLADPRPSIPHDVVMKRLRQTIERFERVQPSLD